MSGWCVIGTTTRRPIDFGNWPNDDLRDRILTVHDHELTVIEMVASYGMAVGKEVFETCVWIGRFDEAAGGAALVYRRDIKLHHCGSSNAKDSNIRQALVDRFTPGAPNHGKGTLKAPGWFHGFSADVWQAMALAVYAADMMEAGEPL